MLTKLSWDLNEIFVTFWTKYLSRIRHNSSPPDADALARDQSEKRGRAATKMVCRWTTVVGFEVKTSKIQSVLGSSSALLGVLGRGSWTLLDESSHKAHPIAPLVWYVLWYVLYRWDLLWNERVTSDVTGLRRPERLTEWHFQTHVAPNKVEKLC